MMIPPRRRPTESVALRTLALDRATEEQFAYYVERMLADPKLTVFPLRETVRTIVALLGLGGLPGELIVDALREAVLGHALECGHTATSVVTGQPRAAAVASRIAKWAVERCAPDHLCPRRRRRSRSLAAPPTV